MRTLEAFELGEKWQDEFIHPKRPLWIVLAYVIGMALTTLGSLPMVKYIFEDGSGMNALVGGVMITVGFILFALSLRGERNWHSTVEERRETYRQQIIDSL